MIELTTVNLLEAPHLLPVRSPSRVEATSTEKTPGSTKQRLGITFLKFLVWEKEKFLVWEKEKNPNILLTTTSGTRIAKLVKVIEDLPGRPSQIVVAMNRQSRPLRVRPPRLHPPALPRGLHHLRPCSIRIPDPLPNPLLQNQVTSPVKCHQEFLPRALHRQYVLKMFRLCH
jgi:hypothetical protein